MAQLFGSELLKVQSSAQTDSGAVPQIVKVDPKQFLIPTQQSNLRQKQEQMLVQALQKEAEAACPLPPPVESIPPPLTQQPTSVVGELNSEAIDKLNNNIERIANALEDIVKIYNRQ